MNLFVGNLSLSTTEENIRSLFSEFGEVVSVKIILDVATGISRGFGFVEIADKLNGFDAIDNLDSAFLQGNIIAVKEAKPSNTRSSMPGNRFNASSTDRVFKPRIPRQRNFNKF